MSSLLTTQERGQFDATGWLLLRGLCAEPLPDLVAEIDRLSIPGAPEVLRHEERRDDGEVQLARLERLADASPLLRTIMESGPLAQVAAELLREPVALFKDKANFKLAGGAGFSVHQDLPAYPGVASVVSAMVALDPATVANGCLECASGAHHDVLPQDERGCVVSAVVETLVFEPVALDAGDVVFFHGLAPHRSAPNRSATDRRALFPTWAPASAGDLRAAYYEAKLSAFAGDAEGEKRLSLIGDFEGELV